MRAWLSAVGLAVVFLLPRAASAADDATLFRLFLRDGMSLISYGEYARVADRVVFSMPTAAGPNPPLQLVNIAADRVDWQRTNRYAESARSARYVATQGEIDYAALSDRAEPRAERGFLRHRSLASVWRSLKVRGRRSPNGRRITSTIARRKCVRCCRCSTKRLRTCGRPPAAIAST